MIFSSGRIVFGAAILMACGLASAAQAAAAYVYNADVYGRLVVDVKVDDGSGKDVVVSACPQGGLFQTPLKKILSSENNYAFAIAISSSASGVSLQNSSFAPVTIAVKPRTFGTDCTMTFQNLSFRSPLFYLGDYPTASFTIQKREDQTAKPAAAVAQDAQIVAGLAATAAGLPGTLASKIDNPLASIINDFQNAATVSTSSQITFDPLERPRCPTGAIRSLSARSR